MGAMMRTLFVIVFGFVLLPLLVSTGCSEDKATGEKAVKPLKPFAVFRHQKRVTAVTFSLDGKTLASGSDDGVVKLWDVSTSRERALLRGQATAVYSLAFSPNGRFLATAGTKKEKPAGREFHYSVATLWDVETDWELDLLIGEEDTHPAYTVAFSPDGKTLALGSKRAFGTRGCKVKLWEVATRQERLVLEGGMSYAFSIAFSPDGRTLATGGLGVDEKEEEPSLKLWDLASGELKADLKGHRSHVWSVAFSPDGELLAAGGGTVYKEKKTDLIIWDVKKKKALATLKGHEDPVHSVAFSPSGKVLASAGGDQYLKRGDLILWEVASRKELVRLEGHTDLIMRVAFSPDGKTLASASSDGTVLLWDVSSYTTSKDGPGKRPAFQPPPHASGKLSPEELGRLWDDLAGEDAPKAYRAIWRLVSHPEQALPLLQKNLRPAPAPDAQRIVQLIAGLDSAKFEEREKANRDLAELADLAGPAVREALAKKPSAEARRRLEELARRLDGPVTSASKLQSLRAIEVLEHIGGAEACKILKNRLTSGAPGALETEEAQAALKRLEGRGADKALDR
jgi:Tol biopolymer transport system component